MPTSKILTGEQLQHASLPALEASKVELEKKLREERKAFQAAYSSENDRVFQS